MKNIYTCTLNPSLDYKINIDKIHLGNLNRFSNHLITEGGKGINVSLSLHRLGINHVAIGFLGGFTGNQIIALLNAKPHIHQKWTMIHESSRINVKLKEKIRETELNDIGPDLEESEISQFKETLKEIKKDDILVLSGSVSQKYAYLYQEISKYCYINQIKLIIDIPGEYYLDLLKYKPWMIKPNVSEFKAYTKNKSTHLNDIKNQIKQLLDLGVSYVCLSLGKKGSILASNEMMTKAYPDQISDFISTGAGDSMIAGFIYGWINQFSHQETHQFMTYLAEKTIANEKIDKDDSYKKIKIRRVGE